MMRHYQAKMMAQMNNVQSMKSEMKYWESSDNYKKAIESHQRYIDFIRNSTGSPQQLIEAYMRMGRFAESMGDRLLATDVYTDVMDVMVRARWDPLKISELQSKIASLHYY